MKITILTYGSAGDVVPYMSLALGLMEKGHDVILAAPQNFENQVKSLGIHYMPLYGNSQAVLESDEGMQWMATGNTKLFFKELNAIAYKNRLERQRDSVEACRDAQFIIVGTLMLFYATTISEKFKIPFLIAIVNPVCVATKAFPHLFITQKVLPFGFLNVLTHKLVFKEYQKSATPVLNVWRKSLGLEDINGSVYSKIASLRVPVIHGYSPHLLPKPADWDEHISVTGFWRTDPKYLPHQPPEEELINWLNAGSAPVYFGFGSMPVLNPKEIQMMVYEICRETGIRAIINAGWSNFEGKHNQLSDPVYFIKYTDLSWLFPLCSLIVHHGGVGTTHISLESGVPTIICSIFWDNPLWGERLRMLDIGAHIRFKDLTKEKLIQAIKELNTEDKKAKAFHLGKFVREENGLKSAIDHIEKYLPLAPVYSN
jgi:sterol 3beta-glucosyltransferase